MKTNTLLRIQALTLAAIAALFVAAGSSQLKADDHGYYYHHDNHGYWDNHNHYHNFVYYHNHHGYWQPQPNGVSLFINID